MLTSVTGIFGALPVVQNATARLLTATKQRTPLLPQQWPPTSISGFGLRFNDMFSKSPRYVMPPYCASPGRSVRMTSPHLKVVFFFPDCSNLKSPGFISKGTRFRFRTSDLAEAGLEIGNACGMICIGEKAKAKPVLFGFAVN